MSETVILAMDREGNSVEAGIATRAVELEVDEEGGIVRSVWYEAVGKGKKGGPGSGHHGHTGVPGKRGGSAPSTGLSQYGKGRVPTAYDNMNNAELAAMITEGLPGRDWAAASEGTRGEVKDRVIDTLTRRIVGDPETVPLATDPESGEDVWNKAYDRTNDFVGQWSISSNDRDMRSLAIQKDASEEFGVPMSEFSKERFDEVIRNPEVVQKKIDNAMSEYQEQGISALPFPVQARVKLEASQSGIDIADVDRDYVEYLTQNHFSSYHRNLLEKSEPLMGSAQQRQILRAMYDETQSQLRAAGLKPGSFVTLYRGVMLSDNIVGKMKMGEAVSVFGNAIESWSLSKSSALRFAKGSEIGQGGVVFKMAVPIEMILSTCTTGFGCLTEGEVTVLGSRGDAIADWIASRLID